MLDPPTFDTALLQRYDRPGPRYTSYPTAPQFNTGFGEAELREAVLASNGDPIPRRLSLYLHVPFCMSPCFYCGCNRIITRDLARGEHYLVRLYREIAAMAALFDRDREVIQIHFGGGTPNFLSPAQLAEVLDTLRHQFTVSLSAERDISIELDPRFVSPADIGQLAAAGFNRASLGVQDFDADVQAAVNRIQSVDETLAIIDACRAHGFRSVNVDLIYGLPRQTLAGFARTLETVLRARRTAWRCTAMRTCRSCSARRSRSTQTNFPMPQHGWRCCSWRSPCSLLPAMCMSAWTISPCPMTISPPRRRVAGCTATSWVTPRMPIPIWSGWG